MNRWSEDMPFALYSFSYFSLSTMEHNAQINTVQIKYFVASYCYTAQKYVLPCS